jgi:hypothetical protein
VLRQLFVHAPQPNYEDKESAAQQVMSLLEQARAIGHAHASDELERSSTWGGNFGDALSSAWQIVNMFVSRIADWFTAQDGDVSEEDIQAQVDDLAETVAGTEVAGAIEQEVMDALSAQGVLMMRSVPQPGACDTCMTIAGAGPLPIADFVAPPYHPHCACSSAPADEGD